MRIGLIETKDFCLDFFKDVKPETFLEESAGVADLITSCLGGRNRKVAEAFVTSNKTFEELEREMLDGQSWCSFGTADIRTAGHPHRQGSAHFPQGARKARPLPAL